jgi:hypothetical protein
MTPPAFLSPATAAVVPADLGRPPDPAVVGLLLLLLLLLVSATGLVRCCALLLAAMLVLAGAAASAAAVAELGCFFAALAAPVLPDPVASPTKKR